MRWPSMSTSVLGLPITNGRIGRPNSSQYGQRQIVHARNAHRARLCVQTGREVADRLDPAADAVLRLEHERLVTLAAQLERRDEAGDAAADDHHALGRLRPWLEALFGHRRVSSETGASTIGWQARISRRALQCGGVSCHSRGVSIT